MKNKTIYLFIIIGLIYLILTHFTNFYIPCPIHFITDFYCPGCGITRMILAILRLDFYKAFRYNPLLFILMPFIIILLIDYIYSNYKNKTPLYKKIDNKIWYILIIILVIYGILRNIFPILAPID